MRRARRVGIVVAVFVALLAYGLSRGSRHTPPGASSPSPAAFPVTDAGSACRAWATIAPVISRDVGAGDRNALFALETGGGPEHEYGPLMRWAELATARDDSVALASDLTVVQTRVSEAASGTESLGDLTVPVTAITGRCQGSPGPGGVAPA